MSRGNSISFFWEMFERRTDPAGFSYVKVQLDVTTQAFYDTDTICDTLKDTVSSGLMGTFFVTDEGFSCRPVEGISNDATISPSIDTTIPK